MLDYEIDNYNPVTGTAGYWVRIPTLSHTIDTIIYMWYGNSTVTVSQENKPGVWSNGYVNVWHFGNGTTLNLNGSLVQLAPIMELRQLRVIGGAANFSGNSQYIATNTAWTGISAYTMEGWFSKVGTSDGMAVGNYNGSAGAAIYMGRDAGIMLWAASLVVRRIIRRSPVPR